MRTVLEGRIAGTTGGAIAEQALKACVHCGMCNATCPTYQLTGDERDGPRGRIYLMKQALEGAAPSRLTLDHLDRCLSCRACETTCPSGVQYHRLYDVAHAEIAETVGRTLRERLQRWAIRTLAGTPALFRLAVAAGRLVRFALPASLKSKLPPRVAPGPTPAPVHARRMLMLGGCVQAATATHFNAAMARILDRVGISLVEAPKAGCCGALHLHLDATEAAQAAARANLDAWAPVLDAGAEAILVNSSGCAAFLKDYPDLLRDDPVYGPQAARLAALVRDPVEILARAELTARRAPAEPRIAVHEPCTLQHGLKLTGQIASLLRNLGYDPQPVADNHLCCGSAGAYSLLQPELSNQLKANKLAALNASRPAAVYTANIGCWTHLASGDGAPVRHWLEAVDEVTRP
ncbi:glycolate oxidase subunit GlcF [Phenylobacterium aquaticum]|uniref:glycolate oxidase subunit GlcF n=1 Tax=Phenylobacterium aquaticum TaxID=1763816 RepID=UPI001F5D6171|nr:glycolate oxidase subunit GlcF [Phenylobacterium aquaticum]MCI3134829.1 glycolate oxidase subunit GlcF [Phenylobacterium aquaticum]